MQQDDPLKLFVGGLPWALTSDDLREVLPCVSFPHLYFTVAEWGICLLFFLLEARVVGVLFEGSIPI